MPTTTNADGLVIKYGLSQATLGNVGSPAQAGEYKVIQATLDYTRFAAFGTTAMVSIQPDAFIPAGAFIVDAEFIATTAFTSGGAATLTVGLYAQDNTTAVDATGIINASALSTINAAGKKLAGAGTSINAAALATASQLSVLVGTANYTAGKGQLKIRYFVPRAAI